MVKKDSLNSIRALLIVIIAIALIFIALFAYSGIWPPVVIIESSSMQHGSQWQYGVINTGDMVIVKKVTSVSDI
ncbi:MAG: S26 family signal peptidase, partial [Thermoplasmata archaeon]